jgi:DNA-binding winged helix-turn-helix (wHTH) protein
MPPADPTPTAVIEFPPFQLDLRAGQLRCNATPLSLRPKTYAVLRHLVEHPGELVTKRALLDAVWPHVAVAEDVVRISVAELRTALGDDRTAPRFIETVPRRGYRFIATFGADTARSVASPPPEIAPPGAEAAVVGRRRESGRIAEWLQAARSGRRGVAFISGEAGIGKTTLVDRALGALAASGVAWRSARGQCVEQYGGGEPYLPVLESLAGLCRDADGETVRAALAGIAPDWVLSVLGQPVAPPRAGTATAASTHEHTLHKLAASLDVLAAETPLVLVLEDIHWSDYATLDLLSVLAQRREPARLLVLCTLRPADAIVHGHPVMTVKRELVRKGICEEILLEGLSDSDVAMYLEARFEGSSVPDEVLRLLVDRTEGNPFFLVTLVDHLLERGLLVGRGERWELRGNVDLLRSAIPEGLRAVIEPRLERLNLDELRVLEMGSVVGPEFAAHAVARMAPPDGELGDVEYVEQICDGMVRRQEILRTSGESTWPDGVTSARYAFRHALYRQVAYQRIPATSCRRLHQAVGVGLETAYGGRTIEIASELVAHFERSRDVERAIRYREEAAAHAGSRLAPQEIRLHLQAAIDLLRSQPESPERQQREASLLHQLGWSLVSMNGWGDEDAFRAFAQVREVAERMGSPAMRLRALESLRSMHQMRAEYATTRTLCAETMALAERLGDSMAAGSAHTDLASALIHLGEIESSHDHAEQARALVDVGSIHGIATRVLLAGTSAHLGQVARAHVMMDEALASAAKLSIPFFSAFASTYAAGVCFHLRDREKTRPLAEESLRLASECGFSVLRIMASMLLGWCDVEDGSCEEGRATASAGLAEYAAGGERTSTSSWQVLVAPLHLACGDVAGANEVLDAGFLFLQETDERIYEHELHRLRGECLVAGGATRGDRARAVEHFERAIAIAAERKSLLFELRAATSLLRARPKAARDRVARLVEHFSGENDCADARAARALL